MIYECRYESGGPQPSPTDPTKKGWAYFDFTCVPDDRSRQKSALIHIDIDLASIPGWLRDSWIRKQDNIEARKALFWIAVEVGLKKWLIQRNGAERVEKRLKLDRNTFPNYPYPERLKEQLPKTFSIKAPSGKITALSLFENAVNRNI